LFFGSFLVLRQFAMSDNRCLAKYERESDKGAMRSTDPAAYQRVPRPVAAMPKDFVAGDVVPPHRHRRAQLLYAAEGVMRVTTPAGTWVVPPHRAVWIPPDTEHQIRMIDAVAMRTIYISRKAAARLPAECVVVEVSALLRELILAAMTEPIHYPRGGRGEAIARLLLCEIAAVQAIPLHVPMPHDRRLKRVCQSVLDRLGDDLTLDQLAADAGASVRTVARLFRHDMGMSFTSWRQQARLAEALTRLARGLPVAVVAGDLGYASPSAFAAMFRRVLGTAPHRYFGEQPATRQS
jgi:AraC-like DNA-binding protein/mannose-6-phosphate isomerase-like protein (cupin superfamily)